MKFNQLSRPWKIGIVIIGAFILFKIFSSIFHPNQSLQIIRSAKVKKGDLSITVTATGEVKPYNRVEIKPPISGRVEEVLVQEGQMIKKGQILAWMSSTERAALLDEAHSQDEETFKHWQEAYKPAPLLAPLDGTVIVRAVEPGQTVTTTDPVVVLSDRLIVEALVDETDLAQIKLGQNVEIHLDAYPDKMILGKVDHISYESKLVNNVNVYTIDIVADQIPEMFRSGMTANVTFIITERKDILLVPSESIVEWPRGSKKSKGSEFAVYQKDFGGKLKLVPVQVGDSDAKTTEVVGGLKQGAVIQIVRKKQQAQSSTPFSTMGQRGGGGRRQS